MTQAEQAVLDAVERRREDLAGLAAQLIAFDTTAGAGGEEAALQTLLADRLSTAGAAVDVWVPDASVVAGSRQVPDGFDFGGRPQLAARFAAGGGGRSLLFNGHIDVVPAGDRDAWTTPPFVPDVRSGRLHGQKDRAFVPFLVSGCDRRGIRDARMAYGDAFQLHR